MNKPHIYADIIKAWADGAEIQMAVEHPDQVDTGIWFDCPKPNWKEYYKYRIKPQTKTPGQLLAEAYYDNLKLGKINWNNAARKFLIALKAESAAYPYV